MAALRELCFKVNVLTPKTYCMSMLMSCQEQEGNTQNTYTSVITTCP